MRKGFPLKGWFRLPLCVLFALPAAWPGFAAAKESEVRGYADPGADVVLYFNTRQAEEAMDKTLWEELRREKEAAIAAGGKDRLFETKGRDIEAIVNLRIASVTPFRGTVEGVAEITGDLKGDIAKMLESLKKNNGPAPKVDRRDEGTFYNFNLPGGEKSPPVDAMFVPIGNNRIHFRANIAPQGEKLAMRPLEAVSGGGASKLPARFYGGAASFILAVRTEKFAGLPLPSGDGRELAEFLQQMKTLCLSGEVRGVNLLVDGEFSFQDIRTAGRFAGQAQLFLQRLALMTGSAAPKTVMKGGEVRISFPVNIAHTWRMLTNTTNRLEQAGKEEEKKAKDKPEAPESP